ncbi:MAG: NfeD family protein [Bacteroidales bacterium]
MHWAIIGVLILIGLTFLVLEILVIPGTGIAGIIGFVLMALGVWQAYEVYGSGVGHLVLGFSFFLSLMALIYALRSKTWNRITLKDSIGGRVNLVDLQKIHKGDEGKATSRLAPMGKAFIGGEFYEVRTTGGYIEQGTKIIVEKIDGNKIYVKRKNPE